MLQKLLSYFVPITIFKKKSDRSKTIEVSWNNGELVLDTLNTNYSYGSLQRVLRYGLKNIGFDTIQKMNSILVLGVAGGSVIKTLVNEINFKNKIIGVDIDSEIIKIANQYFSLNEIPNFEIIIDDAFEYTLKTKETFDLIIIDVFEDTHMPNFLFESFFITRIGQLLNLQGYILFNTMILNQNDIDRNKAFISAIDNKIFNIKMLPKIEVHNELILIQKK